MKNQDQSTPVLIFFLQQNKFNQIIKAILNETVSNNMLTQCGYTVQEHSSSSLDKFKIRESVSRFSIQELVYLKGASYQRPREYQNQALTQAIRKKLKTQVPTAETRKVLWIQFTQIFTKPHLYQQLKQLQLPTQFQIAIEKDILRTYKIPQVKNKTEQVLSIFAVYNPYIGYCQGMNSVIAFLIENGFTCQEAFFIFKRITQELLPCQYYCSMDSIMAYMRIFYEMLSFTHPQCYARMKQIAKEMENSYITMVSFVLQWFVCLFCNDSVDPEIARTIWDFFLLDGITVLFKAGLAMFDLLQPHILKCHTFQQYNNMQKKCIRQMTDAAHIRKKVISTYISAQMLSILKQKLMQQDEKQKKVEKVHRPQRNDKKKCNRKWNVCFQGLDRHLETNYAYQFFVFKPKGETNIIDNYLQKMDKMYFNSERARDRVDELQIGRVDHICQPEEQLFTDDSSSDKNTEYNRQLRRKYAQSLTDPKSPIKFSESKLRRKAAIKVEEVMNKKPGMQRSESILFMQKMVQNVSLSNLLELYQLDEMFQN